MIRLEQQYQSVAYRKCWFLVVMIFFPCSSFRYAQFVRKIKEDCASSVMASGTARKPAKKLTGRSTSSPASQLKRIIGQYCKAWSDEMAFLQYVHNRDYVTPYVLLSSLLIFWRSNCV